MGLGVNILLTEANGEWTDLFRVSTEDFLLFRKKVWGLFGVIVALPVVAFFPFDALSCSGVRSMYLYFLWFAMWR